MPKYRLNEFRSDGSQRSRRDLEFADDDAAINGSDQLHGGYAMELWAADRKVKAFPADRSRRRGIYWEPPSS